MKKLVWIAGLVLGLSIVYPNGITLYNPPAKPTPEVVDVVAADATIVKLLRGAASEDKTRIRRVYSALHAKLKQDNGQRVSTTERWADVQANTLQLAIETPGKYPGLDEAIENVFSSAIGGGGVDPTVVNPVTPELLAKLLKACDIVVASAQ